MRSFLFFFKHIEIIAISTFDYAGLTLVNKQVMIIHYWLFVVRIYTKFINRSGNRLSSLSLR